MNGKCSKKKIENTRPEKNNRRRQTCRQWTDLANSWLSPRSLLCEELKGIFNIHKKKKTKTTKLQQETQEEKKGK